MKEREGRTGLSIALNKAFASNDLSREIKKQHC